MTHTAFSGILMPMTEPIHVHDPRDLVGYPGTPLRKLSRIERLEIKKIVQDAPSDIDPVLALRMALSSGSSIRSEWLQARQIQLALETDDILRNIDRLILVRKFVGASQLIEVLSKRAERTPGKVLRALSKLTLPKTGARTAIERPKLDRDTVLKTIKLSSTLVPLLPSGQPGKVKKPMSQTLLEIVCSAIESCPVVDVAISGLEFLRSLEKHIGWVEIEKEPMGEMRKSVLGLPALIIPELLERGALTEATLLSERVSLLEPAERLFKLAVADALAAGSQLPLSSKNWALRLLQPEVEQEPSILTPTDVAYERLSLVLINAWEAREEGKNAAHAFDTSQQVFRNGFNICLGGEVGSSVAFDPDLHENNAEMERGSAAVLIRPWVELKGASEVRILIKGRVISKL